MFTCFLLLFFSDDFLCADASEPEMRHEVTSLPGWSQPLPSRLFTGFVPAGPPPSGNGTMYFHYMMQEAAVQPESAPIVVWYNGGPGASSLFGMLQELGSLLLNVDSLKGDEYNRTQVPQLQRNEYAWSRNATVIAVDSPPPVGFSYCSAEGPSGDGASCGTWNDEKVAKANRLALETLFTSAFPEFKGRELYIAGESYAGIYVPLLVQEFLNDPMPESAPTLKGFATGDGCVGLESVCGADAKQVYYLAAFLHGHGQTPEDQWKQVSHACPKDADSSWNPLCLAKAVETVTKAGGWYQYDLYDECTYSHGIMMQRRSPKLSSAGPTSIPCPGDAMNQWLNRSDVRVALGIPSDANFFNVDGTWLHYHPSVLTVLDVYAAALKAGLRVMVYNGDTDPVLNSMIAQDIHFAKMHKEGFKESNAWRAWTIDGKKRMGGFVTEYAEGSFRFVTIRGAGHMVPELKPEAASIMLGSFLAGTPLPAFKSVAPVASGHEVWLDQLLNTSVAV